MDTVDRNYVGALIERAVLTTRRASEVAELHGLALTVEQLGFAEYFLGVALRKLSESEARNTPPTKG